MTKHNGRTLDRLVEFDERSRQFRAVEGIEDAPLQSKQWRCDVHFNQGQEGACVGHGWAHELAAKPRMIDVTQQDCFDLYHRAQQLDQWPGEDYSGTSVLAGIKAVQERKNSYGNPLIREYRWAFGTEDVLRTLGHKGPVVLGIEWQSSHYTPDANGQIWLNNDPVGGHCILAKGVNIVKVDEDGPDTYANVDPVKSLVTLHNSWGTDWGIGGDCYMNVYDLNYLLGRDGEACIPMKRAHN